MNEFEAYSVQEQVKKEPKGWIVALIIFLCIPFILYVGFMLILTFSSGVSTEEEYTGSFTTELGDTFDNYYVTEECFLQGDNFCELRQKGKSDYLIRSKESYSNDDVEVIADEEQFRAYLVRGTIIYSQDGDDFRKLWQLTDADGRFVEYVRKNLLSSHDFMSEYFLDYVTIFPEERELIINAIENNKTSVLEKYGYNSDAKELEKMRKELWRYKPDDSFAVK